MPEYVFIILSSVSMGALVFANVSLLRCIYLLRGSSFSNFINSQSPSIHELKEMYKEGLFTNHVAKTYFLWYLVSVRIGLYSLIFVFILMASVSLW